MIQEKDYGVAVIDIRLPGKDGVEVFQEAKEYRPDLKGIIITAYPSVETTTKSIRLGAADYLVKPFGPEEIDELIKTVREGGLAGLQALGQQQMQGASSRLASMDVASSPALQAAMYMPILERLASQRSQFEGNLAGLEGDFLQHVADKKFGAEYGAEMARWEDLNNLWGGLLDIGGMSLLNMQQKPKRIGGVGNFGATGGVGVGAIG